jgi:hypothetical protein
MNPPYDAIADRLRAGYLVPFLGEAASSAYRPAGESWKEGASFLPHTSELAENLAAAGGFPDSSTDQCSSRNLSLVASYYVVAAGRDLLEKRLNNLLTGDVRPGSVHNLLASIDNPERPLLTVTTNYDDLMEQAYGDAPYYLIVDRGKRGKLWVSAEGGEYKEVQSNQLRKVLSPADRPIIYKIHGCINRMDPKASSYVITEEDYVEFLGRSICVPPYLSSRMRDCSFLFLGYSLTDWNVRVFLHRLSKSPNKSRKNNGTLLSWAINKNPSQPEEEIWKRHGVNMYDMDLRDFVSTLAAKLGVPIYE